MTSARQHERPRSSWLVGGAALVVGALLGGGAVHLMRPSASSTWARSALAGHESLTSCPLPHQQSVSSASKPPISGPYHRPRPRNPRPRLTPLTEVAQALWRACDVELGSLTRVKVTLTFDDDGGVDRATPHRVSAAAAVCIARVIEGTRLGRAGDAPRVVELEEPDPYSVR